MESREKIARNIKTIKSGTGNIKLFCFPHAGGGASGYIPWAPRLPDGTSIYALQLPGREERLSESPYLKMEDVIRDTLKEMIPLLNNGKIIFFGHSMGAKIGFLLAGELEKRNISLSHFIASGNAAPYVKEEHPIFNLPDNEFIDELKRFKGTPPVILENPDLIQLFLPMLKADFTLDECFYARLGDQINCPITTFVGKQDKEVSPEEMKEWQGCTTAGFEQQVFEGGHFFLKEQEDLILHKLISVFKKV